MTSRRQFGIQIGAGLGVAFMAASTPRLVAAKVVALPPPSELSSRAQHRFAQLEARSGGRLGVFVQDADSGMTFGHRADEAFPMCSTFKFLAASAVLARVDRGQDKLDRRVSFRPSDLVEYSPVTKTRVDSGMTVAQICDAAVTLSDNTAGNLLLDMLSGPAGLTTFARTLGDNRSRLDRRETGLNEATPGDPRDTTTPAAMLANMRKILLGDALSETSRGQIAQWLVASQTGGTRLRAGFPKEWHVGDKTGAGGHGSTNDIAIAWRPGRGPLLVTAYLTETSTSRDEQNAVLAEVARIVTEFTEAPV